ncbi:MAG: hypothetical protein COW60_01355 [Candidatus Yonathbacteria bacterium CG17_big_fil_post_rev_8_21_14_2_50_43_9]|nr:MAG: hypothetical protein COW60_01355 [Candidatus Yonathbacteria bacterium CG17_big_fil_post_rev_8_21_14_2_50_43_9]
MSFKFSIEFKNSAGDVKEMTLGRRKRVMKSPNSKKLRRFFPKGRPLGRKPIPAIARYSVLLLGFTKGGKLYL